MTQRSVCCSSPTLGVIYTRRLSLMEKSQAYQNRITVLWKSVRLHMVITQLSVSVSADVCQNLCFCCQWWCSFNTTARRSLKAIITQTTPSRNQWPYRPQTRSTENQLYNVLCFFTSTANCVCNWYEWHNDIHFCVKQENKWSLSSLLCAEKCFCMRSC